MPQVNVELAKSWRKTVIMRWEGLSIILSGSRKMIRKYAKIFASGNTDTTRKKMRGAATINCQYYNIKIGPKGEVCKPTGPKCSHSGLREFIY
jgi:hypothetical protein